MFLFNAAVMGFSESRLVINRRISVSPFSKGFGEILTVALQAAKKELMRLINGAWDVTVKFLPIELPGLFNDLRDYDYTIQFYQLHGEYVMRHYKGPVI